MYEIPVSGKAYMAPGIDGVSRRESSRLQEGNSRRVLDSATRIRRLNRQLESLEKDNYQVRID